MTPHYLRNLPLALELFVVLAQCANLNYSGEAITTRYWDCCKPSCAWTGKADVSRPVLSCTADDKPTDVAAGTACGTGGTAFQCSNQQPWAINDTVSYGFAGAFITPGLTSGGIEGAWCCACYQLDFTSDPLRGKSLIIQASNTAYDITSTNRFTLAIPGGNTTSGNACAQQYGVSQTVFGQNNMGVSKKEDCQSLPEPLRAGCTWRFDWFKDASFPSANFKRVVCPAEITNRSGCTRKDDRVLAGDAVASAPSLASSFSKTAVVASILLGVLSI
ncbi:endoglucanase [Paraphoma chrysanthemicola]|nr:endoglucanase [Paraphoma chrysanthemicola]